MNDNRIMKIEEVQMRIKDSQQRLNLVLKEEKGINGNIPSNLESAHIKQESNIGIQAIKCALQHLNEAEKALNIIGEIHDTKDQIDLSPEEIIADIISKSVAGE